MAAMASVVVIVLGVAIVFAFFNYRIKVQQQQAPPPPPPVDDDAPIMADVVIVPPAQPVNN
jgi:heme/copper-type cytochrome/quinol oxidase subunit 2